MPSPLAAALAPLAFVFLAAAADPPIPANERNEWQAQATRVTITRDDWGVAHVRGKTDADAVFGMIYAQAEDDFPRIEANYLTALGRTAEAEGEKAIWADLRARLYVSEDELKADYRRSPQSMRRLMDAWADGLNFFLATHPQVKPRVLKRFEPWMALSFTEGSIGGDIEKIDLKALQAFYSDRPQVNSPAPVRERQGSNGIAIAPEITRDGRALLLINPHTSFYFRAELQMSSAEGLDVYGAATWGQFFVYQGFNRHAGWMHTSSGIDNVDEFAETVRRRGKGYCYVYGKSCRAMTARSITLRFRTADGRLKARNFRAWMTHRGPVVRSDGRRWISFAMMHRPVEALQQSFLRTKATDLRSFLRVAEFQANSSNNTIFADAKGEIAYLHPQFVPRRDDRFDYARAVDGSDPATDWGTLHRLSELPSVTNPANGWVMNTNSWPYRAAGRNSADPGRFPKYMDLFGENFRERHALGLLTGSRGWTLDGLQRAAYDPYQPGFAVLIPSLLAAYDALPAGDPRHRRLAEPIGLLRAWDYRWSAQSIPQTLAMAWGDELRRAEVPLGPEEPTNSKMMRLVRASTADEKLQLFERAIERLERDFGRWRLPWGELNRLQRLTANIDQRYSDSAPSLPVPFADGNFGSLASIRSMPRQGTKRWYGDYGNSFVAVVEFGPRVRARAVTVGGQSGREDSRHFNDQAGRFALGNLRDVYFWPDQIKGHTERVYRPGE